MSVNEHFFRHCWLTLKLSRPRIKAFMDKIECDIEGVSKMPETKKPSKVEEVLNADNPNEAPYVQV